MPTILAGFWRGGQLVLAAIFLMAWGLHAQPADLLIENAKIYTGNPKQPVANSLASIGERIVYVGDADPRWAGPRTRRLNLNGATVVPGFIDSHGHMAGLGSMLKSLNFRRAGSVAAIVAQVRQAAAAAPNRQWIVGRAWDQTEWGGEFPTADQLDEAAPRHPVFLKRVDGHAAWVNRRALEIADINSSTPDPEGGRILRDTSGKPTGILIDKAQALVERKIPARTPQEIEEAIAAAARECARLGITGVHDAGLGVRELEAYRRLIANNDLPVRIYAMIGGAGALWQEYLARGPEIGPKLTVRSIKLMSDGAMGSRGAAFLKPYADDSANSGLLILSRKEIEEVARQGVARGFQVNTHAIGDRANRTVLEAYAAVLRGKNDKRFRIEHAQVIVPEDLRLFESNSVIASIQSAHATSDMRWAEARLGKDRLEGAWLARSFLRSGVPIANGSDFPVEDANPLRGFYAAVARQDEDGQPPQGFLPAERLTREQALRSWTWAGAYAAFEEKDKGTLEAGKLADFVVLSADILTVPAPEILEAQVRMTVLGGQVVYSAE
jgi:predicted amidohydrolase YtcJ